MKRWFLAFYLLMLVSLWMIAWAGLLIDLPELAAIGLLLTTSAPLAFFISQYMFKQQRTETHPVWVSGLSGLGAVMIMVTIYRYGDQHPIWMGGTIATFAGWMLYLKLFKLQIAESAGSQPSKQNELD